MEKTVDRRVLVLTDGKKITLPMITYEQWEEVEELVEDMVTVSVQMEQDGADQSLVMAYIKREKRKIESRYMELADVAKSSVTPVDGKRIAKRMAELCLDEVETENLSEAGPGCGKPTGASTAEPVVGVPSGETASPTAEVVPSENPGS